VLGGLCGFWRLVVSRVVGTGLIIAAGGTVFRARRGVLGNCGWSCLRRGAGSFWGPGVVTAGSGPGGRAVVLGLGPDVWVLPCTPGVGALPVHGGFGLLWACHSVGGLVQVLVSG